LLFHTFSMALFNHQNHYDRLRINICDLIQNDITANLLDANKFKEYIDSDPDLKADFLKTINLSSLDLMTPTDYITYMSQPYKYGGQLELRYFTKLYNFRVLVFRNSNLDSPIYVEGVDDAPILILNYSCISFKWISF